MTGRSQVRAGEGLGPAAWGEVGDLGMRVRGEGHGRECYCHGLPAITLRGDNRA